MTKPIDVCPHCGVILRKQRSAKAHRFFFAVISEAFYHWPAAHPFQADNAEHLRAWLLCKTKHRTIIGERLHQDDGDVVRMQQFVQRAIAESRNHYCFVAVFNGALVVLSPKSIDWNTLDEKAFAPIRNDVFDVIVKETGLDIEELIKQCTPTKRMIRKINGNLKKISSSI
jgi:hypothetical protein